MIIRLDEANQIDNKIEQEDLDAFEQSVRAITNNNFQNRKVRYLNIEIVGNDTIKVNKPIKGLRKNDTLEVNYSDYNDGLYVIDEIFDEEIKVTGKPFLDENTKGIMVTKVEYPADVKRGIKKLIEYDKKMVGKIGIKSETVSRMSTTYYDVNASENIDGYPSALLSFLDKYTKIRWG